MNALAVILGTLAGPAAAVAAVPVPAAQAGATLQACAAIAADTARLACYDRLAGREAPVASSEAAAAPAAPMPAAPAPAADAAAALHAPSAAAAGQSFGLYAAEHPRPPPAATAEAARVVQVGTSVGGHMTVTLEGGQQWELLDDADPLLAAGATVTIVRAALGSFLMQTPSKRSHRVRRLH